MFGQKNAAKYAYQPLVRSPEDEENSNQYYRPPYTKIKLEIDVKTEKPKVKLYNMKHGAREQLEINNFLDLVKHVRYMSKVKMIISFSKLYAMKTSSGGEKRKYGIVLKATHIEVQNKFRGNEINRDNDHDPFLDD